ncbi:MAG: peptidoglycan DD-metalloendopeptidase family protein [Caulobacteraceae bacterium]|nr:peptidoglycan DD-metalloendopeptidase family protein [Caulobacter sp.]
MTRIIFRTRHAAPLVASGLAAALLAGCADQPAYPIAPGGSAGPSGRAETTVRPQYPISPGGSAGPAGRAGEVQVPLASTAPPTVAAPPAEEDAGPRVAAAPVESTELAPPPATPAPEPSARASESASPNAAAPPAIQAVEPAGLGYAELRRREAEQAHSAALARRARLVAAKAKGYLPEKREPGSRAYTLAKGDTLYGVGRRFGLSPKAVASENDLKLAGTLHPGAEISLPEDARDGGTETGAKGRYVVTPGKVIAPTRAERAAALAKAERAVPPVPDLAPEPVETAAASPPTAAAPSPPRPAASAALVAPSAVRPATAIRPAPASTAAASAPPARVYAPAPPTVVASAPPATAEPLPATPSTPRPYASLGPQAARTRGEVLPSSRSGGRTAADAQAAFRVAAAREAARDASAPVAATPGYASAGAASPGSSSGRGRFVWPVRGAVLSTFGPKGPGQRNDGVDIAAVSGEAVRAAAPGEVVYAGHDVAALGNLVAVKHADGWVTIYGNLQSITVHPRDHVVQGGQLGLAGASGDAARPQVHFEVRYAPNPAEKARPIDPQTVLPNLTAVG